MSRKPTPALLVAAMIALTAAGCGDIVTGGTDHGEVRVLAIGDGGTQSAGPRGSLTFVAGVALVGTNGVETPLAATPTTRTVRIEGTDQASIVVSRVPVGSYSNVRITFSSVTADVEGGLVVGGIPLLGRVDVDIGAGSAAVVELPVQVEVDPRFPSSLVIDLRSAAWLGSTDLISRRVPRAAFTSAVRARVQ
jgi:hypothetical protein